MTIFCEFDDAVVAQIGSSVRQPVQRAANLPEAAIGLVDDEAEKIVVIGPDAPLDQVLDFTSQALAERPSTSVILVRVDYDPAVISAALAAGVREVVPATDPAFVVAACERASSVMAMPAQPHSGADDAVTAAMGESLVPGPQVKHRADDGDATHAQPLYSEAVFDGQSPRDAQQPAGKVVTVFSPKGGSGKTTISTNLAVALNKLGRSVCLVDLDLEFGDVAISLQLTPIRTLADAVKTEAYGDEDDALKLLTTEYAPGIDCILAPIEPGDMEKIPASLVTDLLLLLRLKYEYVVIDTPSQFSPHVLAALDASDHHVLLTNPEIPAVKNLRLTLDMLDLLRYPRERRSIVSNRADIAAGLSAEEVQATVNAPIAVQVPASRDVPASINKGVPIVASRPDHPVSAAIRTFAATHLGAVREGPAKPKRRGLFRRRSQ